MSGRSRAAPPTVSGLAAAPLRRDPAAGDHHVEPIALGLLPPSSNSLSPFFCADPTPMAAAIFLFLCSPPCRPPVPDPVSCPLPGCRRRAAAVAASGAGLGARALVPALSSRIAAWATTTSPRGPACRRVGQEPPGPVPASSSTYRARPVNLQDPRTKIVPSKMRGGKELPSSSALDSPSVFNRLATPPPHAINPDMSQVIDDATCTMNDAYDDASTLVDDTVPLGEFLDEQLTRAKEFEHAETDDTVETDEVFATKNIEIPFSHDYPRTEMPEGYVMDEEISRDFLALMTRGGTMTQDPLYPEGHPKITEQHSQRINAEAPSPSRKKKKKKNDRTLHISSEPELEKPFANANDISISNVETQSGSEHSPSDNDNDNDDAYVYAQPDNGKEPDNDVEIEPAANLDNPQPKKKHYDKSDFVARKHGKERE
ncbi:hypothetical protein ZWY2020_033855 [Hordeum vulgare]|nr:hypothetical protein ZWY2020_033855 [Hordeum vulgare]